VGLLAEVIHLKRSVNIISQHHHHRSTIGESFGLYSLSPRSTSSPFSLASDE
jgi:hypothetical protein